MIWHDQHPSHEGTSPLRFQPVGLLAPGLGELLRHLLVAPSQPPLKATNGISDFRSQLQRRGRSGFAPEFPVRSAYDGSPTLMRISIVESQSRKIPPCANARPRRSPHAADHRLPCLSMIKRYTYQDSDRLPTYSRGRDRSDFPPANRAAKLNPAGVGVASTDAGCRVHGDLLRAYQRVRLVR